MKQNILIVDDDKDILELLEYTLSNVGYDVIGFLNTKNVSKVLIEENIDLILMDRNLPGIDGGLYIEMIRSKNINIPVIFVSAKNSSEDIKNGFLLGADDYIVKPFNMEELILRVKAVLKRSNKETVDILKTLKYKDMELDLNMHTVLIDTVNIGLTKLETALLQIFIKNKDNVLDRNFLIKHAWRDTQNINLKTVNVAMKRLKEKIDPLKNKDYIKTVRGVGYILST